MVGRERRRLRTGGWHYLRKCYVTGCQYLNNECEFVEIGVFVKNGFGGIVKDADADVAHCDCRRRGRVGQPSRGAAASLSARGAVEFYPYVRARQGPGSGGRPLHPPTAGATE